MSSPSADVTQLLIAWRRGDDAALARLIPLVYTELRRLAARYMRREHGPHTLQTTALVHEAYLRLAREQERNWENRTHFFAVAAQMMRNLLVDHARANARDKRGGGMAEVVLDVVPDVGDIDPEMLLALDTALKRLAEMDPRAARIVELRYFVGLTNEEAAEVTGVSEKTVKRDWAAAKLRLPALLGDVPRRAGHRLEPSGAALQGCHFGGSAVCVGVPVAHVRDPEPAEAGIGVAPVSAQSGRAEPAGYGP